MDGRFSFSGWEMCYTIEARSGPGMDELLECFSGWEMCYTIEAKGAESPAPKFAEVSVAGKCVTLLKLYYSYNSLLITEFQWLGNVLHY